MEQLDRVLRRRLGDGLIDLVAASHRPHGHHAVGQGLGHGHHVGHDLEAVGAERLAGSPKGADDLVEDQHDVVAVADLAQTLQVALWRHQATVGTGNRLDDASGDGLGAVQVDEALQVVGELNTPGLGLAARELVIRQHGMAQMADAGQSGAKGLFVVDHAGHRDAAEVDAMVGALAADEARALPLAARTMVGQGDLQRRIDGLRAGVHEEHVVDVAGREGRKPTG